MTAGHRGAHSNRATYDGGREVINMKRRLIRLVATSLLGASLALGTSAVLNSAPAMECSTCWKPPAPLGDGYVPDQQYVP